jgi:DNA-binding MarR family transcriptional regulator
VIAAPKGRTANLLGALALAVSDHVSETAVDRRGYSQTAAAALSALEQFLDRPSVDQLSRVVGLTQSGGVRLVDRLEFDGLVRRGSAADARLTTVSLTAAGRRVSRRLARSRLETLDGFLAPLSPKEQDEFAALAGRVLVGMIRAPGASRWICRRCDLAACGRPIGQCPIEQHTRIQESSRPGGRPG